MSRHVQTVMQEINSSWQATFVSFKKGAFSTSASIGVKINIDIHLFYFCVIIKGVSNSKYTIRRLCARGCVHMCGKLVACDQCRPFGSNMSSFLEN